MNTRPMITSPLILTLLLLLDVLAIQTTTTNVCAFQYLPSYPCRRGSSIATIKHHSFGRLPPRNHAIFASNIQRESSKTNSKDQGGGGQSIEDDVRTILNQDVNNNNLINPCVDHRHESIVQIDQGSSSHVKETLPQHHETSVVSIVGHTDSPSSATTASTSSSSVSATASTRIRDYRSELISMTRPQNLPGVVLFHMVGSWLVVPAVVAATTTTGTGMSSKYLLAWVHLLLSPSMMVTLVALLLTSSTSMLVNDYYDYKLGHDTNKPNKPMQKVPLIVAKRFVSYLYATALITSTVVPGVPARLMVIVGLILTFLYTEHLKPITWVKNLTCATLIALSPLTSGLAAINVAASSGARTTTTSPTSVLVGAAIGPVWPLVQLICLLLVGFLGREITMDINDVQDDVAHSIRTVPVKYGYKFASRVAWACSVGVMVLSLFGPLSTALIQNKGTFTPTVIRRMGLAIVGGTAQLRRYWQVLRTEGRDPTIVDVAIKEGLLSVVLILASFV